MPSGTPQRPALFFADAAQWADWLEAHVGPKGIGIVLEAEHMCMSLRGVRSHGGQPQDVF